jgi:hypothetical protein
MRFLAGQEVGEHFPDGVAGGGAAGDEVERSMFVT